MISVKIANDGQMLAGLRYNIKILSKQKSNREDFNSFIELIFNVCYILNTLSRNLCMSYESVTSESKDCLTISDDIYRKKTTCHGFTAMMLSNYLRYMTYESLFHLKRIRRDVEFVAKKFCDEYDKLLALKYGNTPNPYVILSDCISEADFKRIMTILINELKEHSPKEKIILYSAIEYLASIFNFNNTEKLILQYCYFRNTREYNHDGFNLLCNEIVPYSESIPLFFSKAFDVSYESCKYIFSPTSELMTSGILEKTKNGDKCEYELISTLQDLITPDSELTDEILEKTLFPTMLSTDLVLEDYHQVSDIEIMSNLINHSLKENSKGTNVLLWGLPGTGKTELPLLLAKQNGWNLKVIGDIDENSVSEKSRSHRIFSLNIAQKLYKKNTSNIVLLFDEMEDLFKIDMEASHSKAFINRIVEKTAVPIIWTTNSLQALGSAVIRRMTFNIPFDKVPPEEKRKHIWKKYLAKYNKDFTDDEISVLARKFDVVPSLIANMAKVASYSNLTNTEIDRVMVNMDKAVHLGVEKKYQETEKKSSLFNVSYSNTDLDLNRLTDRILSTGRKNFNILSFGPSGTGKSAYAVHLASLMGMKYKIKQASDLLSMWVGGTEQNIVQMFAEAKENNEFLILDEADSFFQNRGSASRSWEVTQVNEMLVGMEKHTLPFVCTTNLEEMLDPAAFRRFTFKIKYDFLTLEQREKLYEVYFKRSAPIGTMKMFDQLAPGDFSNIFEKMDFLGDLSDKEIINMLQNEQEIKPSFKRKIGFGG